MTGEKNSSRVLKPPGGGTNQILFGEGEVKVPSPRPKYDQQNSSNLNFCMNTTDPNILIEQKRQEMVTPPQQNSKSTNGNDTGVAVSFRSDSAAEQAQQAQQAANRGRVPPGGKTI